METNRTLDGVENKVNDPKFEGNPIGVQDEVLGETLEGEPASETVPPEVAEEDRPPMPTGPGPYVWNKGNWCKARAGGRLMKVDQSGTEVRTRTDRTVLARPDDIHIDVWNAFSKAAQKKYLREEALKKNEEPGAAVTCLREFIEERQSRTTS